MIPQLEAAATSVGIEMVVTNSRQELDVQINKLMQTGDSPKMLISWDMDTTLSFDTNGFLNNPRVKMVILLMGMSQDQGNAAKLEVAEQMGEYFQKFIKALYDALISVSKQGTSPIIDSGYKLAPLYGRGKHSGIVARLTAIAPIANC